MPSRRFHAKRRHGCVQCKARRVKCDAGAPCQHCVRRKEQCSNTSTGLDENSVAPTLPSAVVSSPASLLTLNSPSPVETGTALLRISNLELRLLDHYCNFVAPSISAHDHLRRMWQHEITHQAKAHPFLMHHILSTSAHHLSCAYAAPLRCQQQKPHDKLSVNGDSPLVPSISGIPSGHTEWQIQQSKRYELFAMEQQRCAFQTYIPSLNAMTPHNQEALCAASALLSLNALASKQNRYRAHALLSQRPSPIDDWLEISALVRGVDAVVKSAGTNILDGALQPLLRPRRIEPSSDDLGGDVESQVKRLVSTHVLSALDGLSQAIDHCTSNNADKEIYHAALELLRASFAIVAVNPDHESIVMVWSNLLDRRFFAYVERQEPMALVLLAYWTVLFGAFKARWWVGGLNIMILRHIAEYLMSLGENEEEAMDEHEKDRDCVLHGNLPHPCLKTPKDLKTGKTMWRDLLEWPLRENGIHDL